VQHLGKVQISFPLWRKPQTPHIQCLLITTGGQEEKGERKKKQKLKTNKRLICSVETTFPFSTKKEISCFSSLSYSLTSGTWKHPFKAEEFQNGYHFYSVPKQVK
jgi:hypothetical protein